MNATVQALTGALQGTIPAASLEVVALPDCPALRLYLLNAHYPQGSLQPEQVRRVMENPLYWVFCWASGQVLADFLLRNPQRVAGRRVLDFGCGSGVVAIAAVMAGAREVIACDLDPLALQACRLNADLNGVDLTLVEDFAAVDGSIDLITAADVLYDRANLRWLDRFVARSEQVLVADSRVKDFDVPPYRLLERRASCTLPDLDESAEFRDVGVYVAG